MIIKKEEVNLMFNLKKKKELKESLSDLIQEGIIREIAVSIASSGVYVEDEVIPAC